jgi:hypothetical protein
VELGTDLGGVLLDGELEEVEGMSGQLRVGGFAALKEDGNAVDGRHEVYSAEGGEQSSPKV